MTTTSKGVVSIITPCFRSEKYLETFLRNVCEQTIVSETELVLDHNEPSDKEIEIVNGFNSDFSGTLVHNIVNPVVPVSTSMNNCLRKSTGEFLCIWNVDDIREPDSLERMRATLQKENEVLFTYGDHISSSKHGILEGKKYINPSFNRNEFLRSMNLGPFFMWRSSIMEILEGFDEQLLSGADFDYAIRLAFEGIGKKTHGIIGYHLNEGKGASTGGSHVPVNIQPIERTVIELRYGIYDKIDYRFLPQALHYKIYKMEYSGKWFDLTKIVKDYSIHMESCKKNLDSMRKRNCWTLSGILLGYLRRVWHSFKY